MSVLYITQSFIVENLGCLLQQWQMLHIIRCTDRLISLGYNSKNGITGSKGMDIWGLDTYCQTAFWSIYFKQQRVCAQSFISGCPEYTPPGCTEVISSPEMLRWTPTGSSANYPTVANASLVSKLELSVSSLPISQQAPVTPSHAHACTFLLGQLLHFHCFPAYLEVLSACGWPCCIPTCHLDNCLPCLWIT